MDVDALTKDEVVIAEAKELGRERGLPENWLNPNAIMWMPSEIPAGVMDRPTRPGLKVTYADDAFLLATKLVSQRSKDADDIVALAGRLGMSRATPEQLAAHILDYYTDQGILEFILGDTDVDREVNALSRAASQLLDRRAAGPGAASRPSAPEQ